MRINKLSNNMFYDFIFDMTGLNVKLYLEELQMKRTENGVKLKFYLGGEGEDLRKFYFQDTKCIFVDCSHSSQEHDISYEWVQYLLTYSDELTQQEKEEVVDEYNENLENEIESYASKKRRNLISI